MKIPVFISSLLFSLSLAQTAFAAEPANPNAFMDELINSGEISADQLEQGKSLPVTVVVRENAKGEKEVVEFSDEQLAPLESVVSTSGSAEYINHMLETKGAVKTFINAEGAEHELDQDSSVSSHYRYFQHRYHRHYWYYRNNSWRYNLGYYPAYYPSYYYYNYWYSYYPYYSYYNYGYYYYYYRWYWY
jgi:hypothetical protein